MRYLTITALSVFLFSSCIQDDIVEVNGTVLAEKEQNVTLDPGGQLNISTVYVEKNTNYENFEFTYSSDDEAVATIDANGKVTAIGVGMTNVYATAFGFTSDPVLIKVVEDTSLTTDAEIVSPNIPGLGIGSELTLTFQSFNINGTLTSGDAITWMSGNEAIATVNSVGRVSGVGNGTVDIIVTLNDSISDTLSLTVTGDTTTPVSVTVSGNSMDIFIDEMLLLEGEVRNINGNLLESEMITWASSNSSVATVDGDGLVTALTEGTTMITATAGDITSDPYTIMVMEPTATTRMATLATIDYETSGTAILELNNGELDLHFVNFNSPLALSLPGVVVYLSNSLNAADAKANGLRVGNVPQTSGNFTMDVPTSNAEADFNNYQYVFLICEPFTVAYGGGPFEN